MKIRNGFVSNSSSSSFIVEAYKLNPDFHNKKLSAEKKRKLPSYISVLTQEQLDFLNTYKHTEYNSKPMFIRTNNPYRHPVVSADDGNYYYAECVCNQEDILVPLLRNRIPFTSDWHYGHETVIYCGGEEMIFAINYGAELAMYCSESIKKAKEWYKMEMDKKPFHIVKVKTYLKGREDEPNNDNDC